MGKPQSFQDLLFWKKAHQFVFAVYKETERFPEKEKYGLESQFRRAAVSIPANIAKGWKKQSVKDRLRFFNISQGSIEECRYYLILARDLDYIKFNEILNEQLEEVSKMLNAYCQKMIASC